MAELVERDWAMEEIKFWENRAKYYRDMIFDLMAKMMKGVKFNSVEWTVDGITWKEKQSGWIPVGERLPDDGTWNIFTDGKQVSIERYKMDAIDHFFPAGRFFELEDAVAWMPLPEPYEEEQE